MSGKLYIVSTPIGNLSDITLRAIETLNEVDCIACEDTRVTKKILNFYDVKSKLITYNSINELEKSLKIIDMIGRGNTIALVSDAGTPCVSDPGYRLINSCYENKIPVLSIPGASSVIAALSIGGIPTDSFYFCGFLPRKKGRKTKFEFLSNIPSTVVVFESPYRVLKTLKDIRLYMGNRIVAVCKEITKLHESVFRSYIDDIIVDFESKNIVKGEYVILIAKEGYAIK